LKALSRNDLLIMGLLLDRPMHGYELAETLNAPRAGRWLSLGRTSIYYSLNRLERNELVTKHVERHGEKPERTVYSMTDAGRAAFFEAIDDSLRVPEKPVTEFDVAIYHSGRLEPDAIRAAIEDRLRRVNELAEGATEAIAENEAQGSLSARPMFEHRLAILAAEAGFLRRLLDVFSEQQFDREVGVVSGNLGETMLHEALKTLASAKRSGVLTVTVNGAKVGFALRRGGLYGLIPDPALGEDQSLEIVFTAGEGTYEFLPDDEIHRDVVDVGELEEAILRGCRGVSTSTAFQHVMPNPRTLLDVPEGFDMSRVRAELTDVEQELLRVADGVKTVTEIGRRLGAEEAVVVRTAFGLWANGWIVRTAGEKRDLVLAVTAYAQRWFDAVELFSGGRAGTKVAGRVYEAVAKSCPSRFPLGTGDVSLFDYSETMSELALEACDFIECLLGGIATLLGEGFVRDVMSGYAAQLPQAQSEVLIRSQAVPDRVALALAARSAATPSRRRRS